MTRRYVLSGFLLAASLSVILAVQSCLHHSQRNETKLNQYNGLATTDFSYVASLSLYYKEGRGACSSVFVSDSTAFTAGHCVEGDLVDLHSEGRRPLFYIKHPKEDFAILVYEHGTYAEASVPKLSLEQFPVNTPVVFVGYGDNAYQANTCYVLDATDTYPHCTLVIEKNRFYFVKEAPWRCSVEAATKYLEVRLANDPTLKEACLDSKGKVVISSEEYDEKGYGVRRKASGEISGYNVLNGPAFSDKRTSKVDSDPTMQFPMHGDSGGAWFVQKDGTYYLIGIHTLGLGRRHIAEGLNAQAPVFSWLKEQARYGLVDIPDLETSDSLPGLPPEAKKPTETFAIPKIKSEQDIFVALASAQNKKNFYHLAVSTAQPYRDAWFCPYVSLYDCVYDITKNQSFVVKLLDMPEKSSARKFLRTTEAVHLSTGSDGGFSVLMRSPDGSYFGNPVAVGGVL